MTQLSLVTLYTTDLLSARKFYVEFLELEPVREEPTFVAARCGKAIVTLHSLENGTPPTKTVLIFEVDELERFFRRAKLTGMNPKRRKSGSREQVVVRDPDGNDVLIERGSDR